MKKTGVKPRKQTKKQPQQRQLFVIMLSLVGVALVGMIIIGISLYGLDKKENTSVNLPTPEVYEVGEVVSVSEYSLSLRDSSLKKNSQNQIIVEVDTKGKALDGAQLVLHYDKDKVKIDTTENGSAFTEYRVEKNEDAGKYQLFAWNNEYVRTYNGKTTLAKINFTPKSTDGSTITVVCDQTLKSRTVTEGGETLKCSGDLKISLLNIAQEDSGSGGQSDQAQETQDHGPWCKKENSPKPTNVKAVQADRYGEIYMTWGKVSPATHYTVTYGERWMDFDYGHPNIGDTDQFYIRGLKPRTLYYVVMTAVNDCASSGYSDGVSAYSGPKYSTGYYTWNNGTYSTSATTGSKGKEIEIEDDTLGDEDSDAEATDSASFDDDWYDDWYDSTTSASATPYPTFTPTATPETVVEEEDRGSFLGTLARVLPIIGLGILIVLGILLVKFLRGGGGDELPPMDQTGSEPAGYDDQPLAQGDLNSPWEEDQNNQNPPPPFSS